MKLFLKVLGVIFALLVVVVVGLNLYFSDERLKNTVMPYVNEAVGRPVQVESMSLTFFSTFPQPGLSVNGMSVQGESESDTLLALDKLVVGVELSSLFGNEISISEIDLNRPRFTYTVGADGSSNIDFLKSEKTESDTSGGYSVNIPYFEITDGQFGYRNLATDTDIWLNDLDAAISLRYARLIESSLDIELGGLYARVNGTHYVSDLPLSLSEESTINPEDEIINLQQGTLSIRGLNLNLSGSLSDWGSNLKADLKFNSTSDNFGELLRLMPIEYETYTEGLETQGSLSIEGSVTGPLGGDNIPAFDASITVKDGYLKNPDLPQPVEHIQISAKASNNLLVVSQLEARAGSNSISASGEMENPLKEQGSFSFYLSGMADLATVGSFYDLNTHDIESLGGSLNFRGQASGERSNPENAAFNATLRLEDGVLKYNNVARPIENINIDADANQDIVILRTLNLEAARNTFSMKGTISKPLQENNRMVDLSTNLRFDLDTIKDFYPISEDTLQMSGLLTAQVALNGKAADLLQSVQDGNISLTDGFIDYHKLGKPFRNVTLESELGRNEINIISASFETGENNLKATGQITDYLSEDRTVNLKLSGNAKLDEITNYYDLKPAINRLSGDASLNLAVRGQLTRPADLSLNGSLSVSNADMAGDSLVQPVQNLNGKLVLTPASASLEALSFHIGSSDVELSGTLNGYMEFLRARDDRTSVPHLTGSFHSEYLNLDELIEWNESSSDPVPINLPHLTSSVTASVNRMIITGVEMQNLQANAGTTPEQVQLNEATIEMFGGEVSGSFVWDVPRPDHTTITFQGSLDNVQANDFFREYQVLGEKSRFHEYVTGAFSSKVHYTSELDAYLTPLLPTTEMNGSFGMTKSRLKGHPLQEKLAELLNAKEFRNVALDEWKSTFTVDDNVLTLDNLRLTSGDIGIELNGTQHLVQETLNYDLKLLLPGSMKGAIASVITRQAADALTRDNGTLMVPMQVTGTLDNPRIRPDQNVIAPIVQNYLQKQAQDALKKLFGGDNNK